MEGAVGRCALPELGYLERQRSLDAAIAAEQGPAKP